MSTYLIRIVNWPNGETRQFVKCETPKGARRRGRRIAAQRGVSMWNVYVYRRHESNPDIWTTRDTGTGCGPDGYWWTVGEA